ncbi:MAG: PQQ-binding-like beta-propeller repeat protein [Planctomycetota bacterium]
MIRTLAVSLALGPMLASAQNASSPRPRPLSPDAVTSDWPTFLGPTRDSRTPETGLRADLEADPPDLLWEYEIGTGYAPPAIVGDRLVCTHRVGDEIHIDCLDPLTGERRWRHSYDTDYQGEWIRDSGPRSSPVIEGNRVYIHGVDGVLLCLELGTGEVVWRRDISDEYGIDDQFFGVVATPVIYGGTLIQNIGAPKRGASVAAFDLETGKTVWTAGDRWGPSCASPVIAQMHGEDRLFIVTGGETRPPTGGLMVLDPKTGKVLLEHPFRSRTYTSVNGANPIVASPDGVVFLTAAYNVGTARLDIEPDFGFTETWRNRRVGIEFSTPLDVGGHLYMIDGRGDRVGSVVCLDSVTGKEVSRTEVIWDETVFYNGRELEVPLSIGNGTMILAPGMGDRRALLLGDQGDLAWVELKPEGAEILSRVGLFRASETWTPPAVSRGLVYVCQNSREKFGRERNPPRLLCYDLRAASN